MIKGEYLINYDYDLIVWEFNKVKYLLVKGNFKGIR